MLKLLLSPAKSIDTNAKCLEHPTPPTFEYEAEQLVLKLKKKTPKAIAELMSISDNLAQINWSRFQNWNRMDANSNNIQPIFCFTGEVYRGLDAGSLNNAEIEYAQKAIRILSGLYGLLKPLDGISPYRLEMGTKLPEGWKDKNLYQFWGDKLTNYIESELAENDTIINLASKEYSKAVHLKRFSQPIITPIFKDYKNGKLKTIMMYAKKARGAMARYIVQNKIENLEDLKQYNVDSYMYDESLSNESEWVFTR